MSAHPSMPVPFDGTDPALPAPGEEVREITSVEAKSPERRATPRTGVPVDAPANDHTDPSVITSVEEKSPAASAAASEIAGSNPPNAMALLDLPDENAVDDDAAEAEVETTPSVPPHRERRTGPLEPAADAAVIIERLWRRLDHSPPPPSPSFPAILEDVADVAGSVVMAEVASAGIPAVDDDLERDDTSWLLAHIEAQLGAMDRFVARRLAAPFGPRNGLPSLEKAQAALTAEVLSADAVERAVADLSRAFGQRFMALLRTVRRDGTRIRADLAQELRGLGGKAAYLDRLDAALRRATAHEMAARDAMLGDLISAGASAAMKKDIQENEAPDPLLVERWYRRGFVRTLRADIDGLIRAFAAEERALLMHLTNAALEAAAGEAA